MFINELYALSFQALSSCHAKPSFLKWNKARQYNTKLSSNTLILNTMVSSVYKKSLHVHSKPLRTVPVERDCCFLKDARKQRVGLRWGWLWKPQWRSYNAIFRYILLCMSSLLLEKISLLRAKTLTILFIWGLKLLVWSRYLLPKQFGSNWKVVMHLLQVRRPGFNPYVEKIPWRRKWQPTPVLLPGEFHGQRSLEGYSLWGCKETDDWVTNKQFTMTNYLIFVEWMEKKALIFFWASV